MSLRLPVFESSAGQFAIPVFLIAAEELIELITDHRGDSENNSWTFRIFCLIEMLKFHWPRGGFFSEYFSW